MLRLRSPYRWTNDSNYKLGQELRIKLRGSGKQGMLRLKLVDDISGKPIPEFMIVRRHNPKMQTTRNENGEYDVKGKFTRHRKSSVYCYAPGYEANGVKVEALDPESDERVEVRLKPRPSLQVRIVDKKTGKPIPQANVMAASLGSEKSPARYMSWGEYDRYVDGHHSFDFVRRKSTDEFGLVDFSRLPEGEAALIVLVDGYQRTIVRPEDRDSFPVVRGVLQVALEAESSIVGQLTENGQPIADQNVSISSNQKIGGLDQMGIGGMKTDEQGRYEFRSLLPGKYWITVAEQGSRITVGDEQYRHDVDLNGTTVLGKTYSNATIRAKPEFETSYTHVDAYSDSDGKFKIAGLTPGPHRFELNFNLNGYRGNHQSDPIDIVEADEMQIDVFGPLSPEPETAEKPVSKPEEVDYIQLVKVTGISSNRDGKLKVWVSVGSTGERHRLSVGESFQLGDKEYKVKSVEESEATFTGDGKTFVARPDFETRGAFEETEQSYIQLVKVTGITSNRDGKLVVWVSVGPTGERHRLSVGESFQLGDKEYKVKSIEKSEATFTGDGKTYVARPDFETRGAFKETEQSDSNKGERL